MCIRSSEIIKTLTGTGLAKQSYFIRKKVGECGMMDRQISRIILSFFAFRVKIKHAAIRR